MNDKVNGTVSKFNLLSEGDTVMIAFSGGADSVFLCEYLQSVKDKFKLSLKAVHVEHGIRGKESLRDCEFASEYCAKNNIECLVFHINAVEEAKAAGLGIEEYSRNKRYEIFDSISCDKIATAHSLSDNIETVLFRLARGTSLKGLCGIPPKRGKIIRPLIEITSYEIREYLKKHNIPFCVDSTNFDNNYSRNYIRNKIIPEFKNINSEFENNVSRLIENIRENQEFLSEDTDFKSASVFCNGDLKLDKM
ncbi:MAG: tRNA lysidine(34) synthetase TilS, partial [Clostridiales bacterium]|nr:tRNA lysidine(34) synthetase TilS [Clostridiales bacterium]